MNAQTLITRQPTQRLAPAPRPDIFGMGGARATSALTSGTKRADVNF
ncbi:MAG: hypothetical protein ABIV47_16000 [Roseiflexaceae bacterium]